MKNKAMQSMQFFKRLSLPFRYEWLDLIEEIENEEIQLKLIKTLIRHDQTTAAELTEDYRLNEELPFLDDRKAYIIYAALINEVDRSFNRAAAKAADAKEFEDFITDVTNAYNAEMERDRQQKGRKNGKKEDD